MSADGAQTAMGMICEVSAVPSVEGIIPFDRAALGTRRGAASGKAVSLQKAWHGLHFLLTGSAWEGTGPLAFIASGGEEVPGSDHGYGPARLFSPEETTEINSALSEIDDAELWSRFNPEEMTGQEIYPDIWDEPEEDLKEEYLMYFNELKKLIAAAAARGDSLRVSIT
jgi:hypothetical protein